MFPCVFRQKVGKSAQSVPRPKSYQDANFNKESTCEGVIKRDKECEIKRDKAGLKRD